MRDVIQLLPDHVANQIAAGEVVQRPASVVKELLENAIDAQSNSIKLVVKDAGKTLIQVIDNGVGMSETDTRLSFERHATSKIKEASDLFKLTTKGFRGEALASIAAIAQVNLTTRRKVDELGTFIQIEGSAIINQQPKAAPVGTTISVKNLFFNIPARRNFLKSNSVEFRHIIDEFHRVALTHCNIAFSLYHNENILFQLSPTNKRQRIVQVFGKKTNEKLVPVQEDTELIQIDGFILKPEFSKKSRQQQFFFVNNRFVKCPYLHHAVMAAFEGLLVNGHQPGYFLFLHISPDQIDINIHPTKTEIKFEDDHTLYAILRSTIKHSLGQFNVAPILDFNRNPQLDPTVEQLNNNTPSTPRVQVDQNFNPFRDASPANSLGSSNDWQKLYEGLQSNEPTEETMPIIKEDAPAICFQLQRKYIVSSLRSGLLVMHQNRAHERILFEQFIQHGNGKSILSQSLLFPINYQAIPAVIVQLKELQAILKSFGFGFEKWTEDSVHITNVHPDLHQDRVETFIETLLETSEHQGAQSKDFLHEYLARQLAEATAITSGTNLDHASQLGLISSLFSCTQPDRSPSGKPIFVTLSPNDFEQKFNL